MKTGVLLVNLGTPDDTRVSSIRRYLHEFLLDRRVIDLPKLWRYLLVYGAILPFRPFKTAKAYRKIWQAKGSPLRLHSQALTEKVQLALGDDFQLELAMRYGQPSIQKSLEQLKHCGQIIVLPLFPQYSSAATGSAIEKVLREVKGRWNLPRLSIIDSFYNRVAFTAPLARLIAPYMQDKDAFLLLSYHGLPERHLDKSDCQATCDRRGSCPNMTDQNYFCYRAQCYQTSRAVAHALSLSPTRYMSTFQSRLGRIPWIKPYTDQVLIELRERGVKDLVIACPAFVADCLETLEEIGIQARQQWLDLGGRHFSLVPCVNDQDDWAEGVAGLIREQRS